MKFIARKGFYSPRWGNVKAGDTVEVDRSIAKKMVDSGYLSLSPQAIEEVKARQEQKAKKGKK